MKRALAALGALALVAADSPLRVRMRDHWRLASACQSAVIQGDLAGVRAAAARLAEIDGGRVPPELEPGLPGLLDATRRVAEAPDIPAASRAEVYADLLAQCAECHASVPGAR